MATWLHATTIFSYCKHLLYHILLYTQLFGHAVLNWVASLLRYGVALVVYCCIVHDHIDDVVERLKKDIHSHADRYKRKFTVCICWQVFCLTAYTEWFCVSRKQSWSGSLPHQNIASRARFRFDYFFFVRSFSLRFKCGYFCVIY